MSKQAVLSQIEAGQGRLALANLRVLLDAEPTQTNVRFGLAAIEQIRERQLLTFKRVRLAILPTFTADPLLPYLRMRGYLSRLDVIPYLGAFNQVQQEVLNPESGLYVFDPDVVVLAVRSQEFVPDLYANYISLVGEGSVERAIESTADRIRELIASIRQRTDAMVVLHNFAPPPYPDLGLVDSQRVLGQVTAFHQLNAHLSQIVADFSGIYVLDYAHLVARLGWSNWHDSRMWYLARMPFSAQALPVLAEAYVSFLRPLYGLNRKCLVLDLDNTLWGGIVGEDGLGGIHIGHDYPGNAYRTFQEAILRLYDRGIILAINSRNNEADVLEVFDRHPEMILRREHFAAIRINWQDKASNMRSLAQELNIGLDHMVFVDDSPVERELVRTQLPQVLVLELPADPAEYVTTLEQVRDFDALTWSTEDRKRTEMYRTQAARRRFEVEASSLEEFYAGLDMEVVVGRADPTTIPRIAQLTQRTNQFNLTTRRYSEADISRLAAADDARVYHLRLVDRFGDNGIVGVAIIQIEDDVWDIDTFLLSCRVLGRTVEDAFLSYVANEARKAKAHTLRGSYIPTAKNAQVATFYPVRGFEPEQDDGGETKRWRLVLSDGLLSVPPWMRLRVLET